MKFSKAKTLALRRERLWHHDPHCHWCGVLTALMKGHNGRVPPNMATIDHLRCRLHPGRLEPNPNREMRTVLACWKCNNERSFEEQRVAGIEAARKSSGTAPLSHHLNKIIQWYVGATKHGYSERNVMTDFGLARLCEIWLEKVGIRATDNPKDVQHIQEFIAKAKVNN